jgi:hypothetical protein
MDLSRLLFQVPTQSLGCARAITEESSCTKLSYPAPPGCLAKYSIQMALNAGLLSPL